MIIIFLILSILLNLNIVLSITCTQTYTVISGDTGYGIAAKFNILFPQLQILNPEVTSFNTIAIGQQLCVNGPTVTFPSIDCNALFSSGTAGDRIFSPYLNAWNNPALFMKTVNSATCTNNFHLAFITADSNGNPGFNGYGAEPPGLSSAISDLRAKGGDVSVSFGGAAGNELALVNSDVPSLISKYDSVIQKYALKSIDFDIEGTAITNYAANNRRNQAIKALQLKYPNLKVTFTLPVLPGGILVPGIDLLKNAVANGVRVDAVNIMAMDYGYPVADMGLAATKAADSTRAQLLQINLPNAKVGITVMIGVNDTPQETFWLSRADLVAQYAKSKPWINMLSFWNVQRDVPVFSSDLSASSQIPQGWWQFCNSFIKYQIADPPSGTCVSNLAVASRIDCGYTSLSTCTGAGCCWGALTGPGPWCYKTSTSPPPPTTSGTCVANLAVASRIDCGYTSLSTCTGAGCCWGALTGPGPWCYKTSTSPPPPTTSGTCVANLAVASRIDCGYTSLSTCTGAGCCWGALTGPGPWCYKTSTSPPPPTTSGTCVANLAVASRIDCGYTSLSTCTGAGCCWGALTGPGPWCYKTSTSPPPPTTSGTCVANLAVASRIDCGATIGASATSCAAGGCCWGALTVPGPWCYKRS